MAGRNGAGDGAPQSARISHSIQDRAEGTSPHSGPARTRRETALRSVRELSVSRKLFKKIMLTRYGRPSRLMWPKVAKAATNWIFKEINRCCEETLQRLSTTRDGSRFRP